MIKQVTIALLVIVSTGAVAQEFYVLPSPNNAPATGVFTCEIMDARSVSDQGTQVNGKLGTEWFWDNYRHFEFDASTGVFSTEKERSQWIVLRPGSPSWDLIAHLPGGDPVYNLLRIEVWNNPIKFSLTDGMDHFSGICRITG